MAKQVEKKPERKKNLAHIVLLALALLLPSTMWMVFGWTSCFLPLLVFFFINKYGWRYTNNHLVIAGPAALFLGYLFQSLELVFFSTALLPAGYAAAYAAQRGDLPWQAGLKAWLTLCLSFFLFFGILLINSEISFFQAVTASLHHGIDEALRQYRASDSLSAENFAMLEQTLEQVKAGAPLIMPAILGGILLLVSWVTLVLGNALLPKTGAAQPWPDYRCWCLPETLVWGLIISGVAAMIPGNMIRIAAINCVIIITILYSFQGLAILAFLLDKWNIPRLVRSLIYIMIILQSFGTVLLIVAGVADVWFDIRRIHSEQKNDTTDTE
ncbi:DUF2232 domain-containing protein [Desulfopila inferna]|uniref:DUF2232 domain-containing protein n=1 Tax=Desulfopila inferna TaxID=468528 RepID=UPI001963D537|nr:DUF2232 domain-containing protein [Desulfopila inferna]